LGPQKQGRLDFKLLVKKGKTNAQPCPFKGLFMGTKVGIR